MEFCMYKSRSCDTPSGRSFYTFISLVKTAFYYRHKYYVEVHPIRGKIGDLKNIALHPHPTQEGCQNIFQNYSQYTLQENSR